MGIFNLSQDIEEKMDGKQQAQDTSTTEAAVKADGEDTYKDSVKQTQTDVLTQEQNKAGDQDMVANKEEQTITLDGPLSHIYTQALNMAYSNEGMTAGPMLMKDLQGSTDDQSEKDRIKTGNSVTTYGTYVYCVDSTDLNSDGLVASTEAIRTAVNSKKYKNVILALESNSCVTSKTQLLGEMGEALGVKVCMTRTNAVRTVLGTLKKG